MRTITRLALAATSGAVIAATGLAYASDAHADGYLSSTEAAYVDRYGAGAVCPVIDEYPSAAGVLGVTRGIMEDGFTADNAVDIINASVSTYCPRNWPLLVAIGNAARGHSI